MIRGREKFKRYQLIINIICRVFSLFPKKIQKQLFVWARKKTGYIGLVIRYVLIKNIAKSIGDNVSIQPDVYIFNPENLIIGNNVSIHPLTYIEASGGIVIGNDVSIAHGVTIMSESHNYLGCDIPIKDQGKSLMPVKIKDNVWIGAKAVILGNKVINSGAVIGAGAVVTHDVKENTVVGGVPAKVLKNR